MQKYNEKHSVKALGICPLHLIRSTEVRLPGEVTGRSRSGRAAYTKFDDVSTLSSGIAQALYLVGPAPVIGKKVSGKKVTVKK